MGTLPPSGPSQSLYNKDTNNKINGQIRWPFFYACLYNISFLSLLL